MASVEIIGRGKSIVNYHRTADVTWGICLAHLALDYSDLGFFMDDMRILNKIKPELISILQKDKHIPSAYMTPKVYKNFPKQIEYPMQEIYDYFNLETLHTDWFNNSVAYAIAYAIYKGFDEIHFHGIDYADERELTDDRERECTSFWIGIAVGRGIKIKINSFSELMARSKRMELKGRQHYYGYVEKPEFI